MVERKKASPLSPVKVNDGAAIKENITMSENPRKEISLNMVCVPSLQAVPLHCLDWWGHRQDVAGDGGGSGGVNSVETDRLKETTPLPGI